MRRLVIAVIAFMVGSASVAAAGPAVSGFVGLVDGANTAHIDASGQLSVSDRGASENARQPVALAFSMNAACGAFQCYSPTPFTVPDGKRLVITEMTGWGHVLPADTLSFVGIQMKTPAGAFSSVFITPAKSGHEPNSGEEEILFGGQHEVRVEAGTTVSGFIRCFATTGVVNLGVYAYLVDVP